ncbi:YxeA family protein [Paenibacillus glacialis]|uniref:Cytoplasmic protein n=1 Tax=Paenibacillus glacialis TaxID=494026 RepID=A0A168LEL8_9BACL|nr:YxeA family protein [Paenibacillus glacialis]OAB43285.1 cytoplasmic protein [Paenibacillus glacialis]
MKKLLASIATFTLFASFAVGCDVSSPSKIGTDEYYVQIQGEGEIKDKSRYYTLPTYDENGVEKKVTFTSVKPNNEKLKENAFLRLYIKQDDKKKTDIPDTEVKSYEEVQKDDLPAKTKEKLGG